MGAPIQLANRFRRAIESHRLSTEQIRDDLALAFLTCEFDGQDAILSAVERLYGTDARLAVLAELGNRVVRRPALAAPEFAERRGTSPAPICSAPKSSDS